MALHQEAMGRERQSISVAIKDLDANLQRFNSYLQRLQEIVDRINGPEPRPIAESSPSSSASGLVPELNRRRNEFSQMLDTMEQLMNSMDRGL